MLTPEKGIFCGMFSSLRSWYNEIKKGLSTEGSFVRNSAWMFSASGLSILMQLVFFPILSRIYTPEDYGVFGVFNFYTTTLGTAILLGYNQAFILPNTERSFGALLRLTIWITLGLAALCFGIQLIWGKAILAYFHHESLGHWAYMIIPVALFMAFDRLTTDWAIRQKEFKKQMIVTTSVMGGTKVFNILYGWAISASAAGLIWTAFLQHFLKTMAYMLVVIKGGFSHFSERFAKNEMAKQAREYKEFPLYIYWGGLINMFSSGFPSALLPVLNFSMKSVGFYNNALIVLDIPLRIFGSAITSVYSQKAAELVKSGNADLAAPTWKIYRSLTLVSLVFLGGMMLIGEPLYAFAFGESWRTAGAAAELLAVYYFFRMISAPLTSLFGILRREKEFFLFQLALMVARLLSLWCGSWVTDDFLTLMLIFSVVNAVAYFGLSIWIFALVRIPLMRAVTFTLLSSATVVGLVLAIKMWWV